MGGSFGIPLRRPREVLPLGLICFFDKANAYLFGSIAASPLIGVPSFLNIDCQCNTDFWLPFGYVPNLAYGKGKASQQTSRAKLQDLHNCIRLVTKQIAELRDKGYFWTVVMGRVVKVVVGELVLMVVVVDVFKSRLPIIMALQILLFLE